jgi:Cu/Ag efflux protein CusF
MSMVYSRSNAAVAALMVALMVFGFILAGSLQSHAADQTTKITGKVVSVDAAAGKIMVEDSSGKVLSLSAGSDVDLKYVKEGDNIQMEVDNQNMIHSIQPIQ